jgi:hypothetical protein
VLGGRECLVAKNAWWQRTLEGHIKMKTEIERRVVRVRLPTNASGPFEVRLRDGDSIGILDKVWVCALSSIGVEIWLALQDSGWKDRSRRE